MPGYFLEFKPKREIDADQLRSLSAIYGNRTDVAKTLKMHYSQLCKKINESVTLKRAWDEGVKEFRK